MSGAIKLFLVYVSRAAMPDGLERLQRLGRSCEPLQYSYVIFFLIIIINSRSYKSTMRVTWVAEWWVFFILNKRGVFGGASREGLLWRSQSRFRWVIIYGFSKMALAPLFFTEKRPSPKCLAGFSRRAGAGEKPCQIGSKHLILKYKCSVSQNSGKN
jgi:hypothetical protein